MNHKDEAKEYEPEEGYDFEEEVERLLEMKVNQ